MPLPAAPKTTPSAQTEIQLNPYENAFVAFKTGKYDEALKNTDDLLAQTPDDSKLLLLKARILQKQKKYKESQDVLLYVNGKNQNLDEVYFYLGEDAFGLGNWGEAIQNYQTYLKKTPGARDAILKMIYCYLIAGNFHNASLLVHQLDPRDDQAPTYYFARAAMVYASNKPADHQKILQQARTIYGNDVYEEYELDLLYTLKKLTPGKNK